MPILVVSSWCETAMYIYNFANGQSQYISIISTHLIIYVGHGVRSKWESECDISCTLISKSVLSISCKKYCYFRLQTFKTKIKNIKKV